MDRPDPFYFIWPPYFLSPTPVPNDLTELCKHLGRGVAGRKADPGSMVRFVTVYSDRDLAERTIAKMKDVRTIAPYAPKTFTELIAILEKLKELGETTVGVDPEVHGGRRSTIGEFIKDVRDAQQGRQ